MADPDDAPDTRFLPGHAVGPTAEYPAVPGRSGASPQGADGPGADGPGADGPAAGRSDAGQGAGPGAGNGAGNGGGPPGGGFAGALSGGGPFRSLFWLVATLALILAMVVGVRAVGLWPNLSNPFADKQTDRSQPVLLKSIQDLSRFVAAEGNFEVIIDVQQNRQYIPEFLINERTLFVAAGTVDAYVDFSAIGAGAIVESEDRKSVEIRLPAPALGEPNIDNERSYVYATQRGLLNRLGDAFKDDPNRLRDVYRLADEKIAKSAVDSGLRDRAQENTRKMLDGMLRSLGYTTITVTFAAP